MDFTEIDRVIELLEKKVSPGSPPVIYRGVFGVWRTIRGFRLFLELTPGAGRYNFGGKSYKGGRVLVGPPSLTGKDINNVGGDTWGGLSGSGTKKTFGDASPEGLKALKQSVLNSISDDDTRKGPITEAGTTSELVQFARSAGFTDDEIKQAIDGKVFTDGFEPGKDKGKDADVISITSGKDKKEAPKEEKAEDKAQDDKKVEEAKDVAEAAPERDTKPQMAMAAGGENLGPVIEAMQDPNSDSPGGKEKLAEALKKIAEEVDNEFLRKQLEGVANGLLTGDFTVAQARERVRAIAKVRIDNLKEDIEAIENPLPDKDIDGLHDKEEAKRALQEIREKLAEMERKAEERAAEQAQAEREFIIERLEELAAKLRNPEVVRELQTYIKQAKSKRLGGRSMILRILQILRFILAFIPG